MEGSPVETAHFLINFADYLSKSRLGDFINGVEEFNQCVCAQLMTRWYSKRLRIDEALRRLVKYVKLPNESQQIDRILEKFWGHLSRSGLRSVQRHRYRLRRVL